MSVDPSPSESASLRSKTFLKSSHRTLPEQLVGLGIWLSICLGLLWLGRLSTPFYQAFPQPIYQGLSSLYSLSLGLGMWLIWRANSLTVLRLELTVFLGQLLFQAFWSASFFGLHQMLLSLVSLLLLWSTHILACLLFWKREKLAGALLVFPAFWILYLVGLNMIICISTP